MDDGKKKNEEEEVGSFFPASATAYKHRGMLLVSDAPQRGQVEAHRGCIPRPVQVDVLLLLYDKIKEESLSRPKNTPNIWHGTLTHKGAASRHC